jgi:glyoxylase I family protein
MFKRIDHVEIVPTNFERSLRFYRDVLGFQTWQRQAVDMPPLGEIAYLKLNDTMLELLAVEGADPPSESEWQAGYRMMALEVEDMEETVAYLEERGVEITWGPVELEDSKRAEITDPDGLGIELREWC